jgi:4-amino-4-deoxy-L-arabinose transferase-like glycosyltransferase
VQWRPRSSPRPRHREQPGLDRRTLLVIAGIALAVRIVYVLLAVRHYVPSTDDAHYSDIARKVSEGKGFSSQFPYLWTHPTAFRPPLYPSLLGAAYAVFGVHIGVAQALNVLLGTGVVVLAAMLAHRLGGRTAALVAAGLATVHPALLAGDGVILTEPLALLLMLAALLALDRDRYALAGLLAGLLVLTRPSAQAYVPVVALYLLFAGMRRLGWRAGWKTALRGAVVFGLVAVVTVTPWVIRNQIQFGKPVLVTSNGFNLAAIWSPLAIRSGGFIDPIRDPRNAAVTRFSSDYYNLNEANLDATLRKEGLDGLRANKGRIPSKLWQNVRYYTDISWRANDNPERLDGRNLAFRHATLPFVWLVEILGLVGFVLLRRRRLGVLVLLTAAYMTAVSLITVSPPRLRAPVDVLFCVAIGVLVAAVLRWRKRPEPVAAEEPVTPALAEVG